MTTAVDRIRPSIHQILLLTAIVIFVLVAVGFNFFGIDLNFTAVGLAFFAASFWG